MATGSATRVRKVIYPTTDGRPMAETDIHRDLMFRLIQILKRWFADKPMVYVSGNLLIYYVPGDKRRHVAPDVFVVFGVQQKNREYYLCWEEGKFPAVVIEVTSKTTKGEDNKKKYILYRDVFGVKEYFQFDPRADYIGMRLRGYRLVKGEYVPMAFENGRLYSKHLGLYLQVDGANLQLIDPDTGQELLGPDELAEQEHASAEQQRATAEQERAAAEQERRARAQAEASLRQKQAEVESERLARRQVEELLKQKAAELEALRSEVERRRNGAASGPETNKS